MDMRQVYVCRKDNMGRDLLLSPIEEQRTIISIINQEGGKIDAPILKLQESIERLKEYGTALISAAVTGKIDGRRDFA